MTHLKPFFFALPTDYLLSDYVYGTTVTNGYHQHHTLSPTLTQGGTGVSRVSSGAPVIFFFFFFLILLTIVLVNRLHLPQQKGPRDIILGKFCFSLDYFVLLAVSLDTIS